MTFKSVIGKTMLVAIGVGVPALILAPAIREARPAGGLVFPENPVEYRRVDTGLGVSIIRPSRWDVSDVSLLNRHVGDGRYDHFYMRPYQYLATTRGCSISVFRSTGRPDFDQSAFREREFHGRRAWEGYAQGRNNRFDEIGSFNIHIQDGQHWVTISYSCTKPLSHLPDETKAFLESARFDDPGDDGSPSSGTRSRKHR